MIRQDGASRGNDQQNVFFVLFQANAYLAEDYVTDFVSDY